MDGSIKKEVTYHRSPPVVPTHEKVRKKRATRNQGAKQQSTKKQRVSTTEATEHVPAPKPGSTRDRSKKVIKRTAVAGQNAKEQSLANHDKYLSSSTARQDIWQDIQLFQESDHLNLRATKINGSDPEWAFSQHTKAPCLREPITELVASLHTFENGEGRAFTPDDWLRVLEIWEERKNMPKLEINLYLILINRALSEDSPLQPQNVKSAFLIAFANLLGAYNIKHEGFIELIANKEFETYPVDIGDVLSPCPKENMEATGSEMFSNQWPAICKAVTNPRCFKNRWASRLSSDVWNTAKNFLNIWTIDASCELGSEFNIGLDDLMNSEFIYFLLRSAFSKKSAFTIHEKKQLAHLLDAGLAAMNVTLELKQEGEPQNKIINWRDWLLSFKPGVHSVKPATMVLVSDFNNVTLYAPASPSPFPDTPDQDAGASVTVSDDNNLNECASTSHGGSQGIFTQHGILLDLQYIKNNDNRVKSSIASLETAKKLLLEVVESHQSDLALAGFQNTALDDDDEQRLVPIKEKFQDILNSLGSAQLELTKYMPLSDECSA
ncbi:hypothetical protein [Parendozoicomonas sp. Alg238-R29]|uniref:hypothetical protein n=1 Tax=Parendozoicomonas sp. Alg238-R29 TaxID=2993446 RepID=UPI00248F0290|nr:hypothetical protein [Parendozoicomonas sp. Alg238-R29]